LAIDLLDNPFADDIFVFGLGEHLLNRGFYLIQKLLSIILVLNDFRTQFMLIIDGYFVLLMGINQLRDGMLLPPLLDHFQCSLILQVQGVQLVLAQNRRDGLFEQGDLLQQQADVELLLHLLYAPTHKAPFFPAYLYLKKVQ
jgi:hypothetical protein